MEQVGWDQHIDALSIYRAFEPVEDKRYKRGVRYAVALLLTLTLLGKLAGMTSLQARAEWIRLQAGWLRVVLPSPCKTFPCAATSSNVFRAVAAEQVHQIISPWLCRVQATQRCGEEASRLVGQQEQEHYRHVALDDKSLRGTLLQEAADQAPMHHTTLYISNHLYT